MFTSEALTKVHSIILLALIVVVALGGSATYVLLSGQDQSFDAIKIGVLADLDGALGRNAWQAAILAAEQINVEGGILGRQVEVIGEDHDVETGIDIVKVSSALTRLITYHKADFIIGQAGDDVGFVCQDIISEHKKILLSVAGTSDELSQRVLNDYDKYKYYFKVMFNASTIFQGMSDSLLLVRENTGFNKVGYLGEDLGWTKGIMEGLDYVLSEVYGFDL
ncbi:MAG: ABC transporter substrate-binding protein, partial [Candidatus Bathyarchaeota archaeon]|nr:ABC transporter substrate-binding protein [Candidatus Bathyarchaeota archaeon]